MKNMIWRVMTLCIALMVLATGALASTGISTTVTMRVSKLTQDAVVNVGEDLSIDIAVAGVNPSYYQWYFNDAAIKGADQRVYNLVNAQVKDAGVYRMDAFDADGKMLLSIDIMVRVVENRVPKAGDTSNPVLAAVLAVLALGGFVTMRTIRKRA